ncbi:MAG: FliI/YscN family ATPase [Planctomycetales bacterium]|nr:FliI/YscN family ATPase [Planctomycetales bacterium]
MTDTVMTASLIAAIRHARRQHAVGRLRSATGLLTAELPAAIGDLCVVHSPGERVEAEVVGFQGPLAQMLPFHHCRGLRSGARVRCLSRGCQVPRGAALLGRVLDGLGRPVDGGPALVTSMCSPHRRPPLALQRPRVTEPLVTRQRAIDCLVTLGVGQRVGIFAGSGVGKSTLLGEIAKGAEADCCVMALVGERGREVLPFIEDCLGEEGRRRSVTIVATADETPLMRIRATETAVSIAESFRDEGRRVLLMIDSLTRFATAQREIGLMLGEPPSMRGYPPSVFQRLAALLERLGNNAMGSITALLTVLVDSEEEMDDPIADAVRSIVDGHLVLDRDLAEAGHYPAIRIASSLSRVFPDIVDPSHQLAARKIRAAMAEYHSAEDLIRVGAYQPGSSQQVDLAVALRPLIRQLLTQQPGEFSPWSETRRRLQEVANRWPF